VGGSFLKGERELLLREKGSSQKERAQVDIKREMVEIRKESLRGGKSHPAFGAPAFTVRGGKTAKPEAATN